MKALNWMLAMTALGVLLVITGIFLESACSNVDAQHLTSPKQRVKPSLGVTLEGDALILEGYFNRPVVGAAMAMSETMYNPAGRWYDAYYGILDRIAEGEEVNVILRRGGLLRFQDGKYWVQLDIGLVLYPAPRPKAGDVDGDGDVDLEDAMIVIDIILEILV